tara:strand:- start:51 stop:209 length:159 start_codon:yes stop_codon:yes gene_type:complete
MTIFENEYNLKVVLKTTAESPEEARHKDLMELSQIQANLANNFTTTELHIQD